MPSSAAATGKFQIFFVFRRRLKSLSFFFTVGGGGWKFLMIFSKNLLLARNFRTKKGTVIVKNVFVRK
jgi:hypothetical protein